MQEPSWEGGAGAEAGRRRGRAQARKKGARATAAPQAGAERSASANASACEAAEVKRSRRGEHARQAERGRNEDYAQERTAYLDGRLQLEQHWLVHEDLARLRAQAPDLSLTQVDLLARSRAAHLEQLLDDAVDLGARLVRRGGPCYCRRHLAEGESESATTLTLRRPLRDSRQRQTMGAHALSTPFQPPKPASQPHPPTHPPHRPAARCTPHHRANQHERGERPKLLCGWLFVGSTSLPCMAPPLPGTPRGGPSLPSAESLRSDHQHEHPGCRLARPPRIPPMRQLAADAPAAPNIRYTAQQGLTHVHVRFPTPHTWHSTWHPSAARTWHQRIIPLPRCHAKHVTDTSA